MMDKFFPKNEHIAERAVRIVVGLGLLSLVFVGPRSLFGLLGIVPIVTGLLGSCPVYTLFGISTCSTKTKTGVQPATGKGS